MRRPGGFYLLVCYSMSFQDQTPPEEVCFGFLGCSAGGMGVQARFSSVPRREGLRDPHSPPPVH